MQVGQSMGMDMLKVETLSKFGCRFEVINRNVSVSVNREVR